MLTAAPFVVAVPVAFVVAIRLRVGPSSWLTVRAGAAGWFVALAWRNSIALVAYRRPRTPERVRPWLVLATTPAHTGPHFLWLWFLWLWLARRPAVATDVSLAVVGALALAGGLMAYVRV